jgi:chromosome segregation ATPase
LFLLARSLFFSIVETNQRCLQITKVEINQLTEQINQQNDLINSKENQIESHTKELHNLENCLSTTHEELLNQRTKVNESKTKIKLVTLKMHQLIVDEKPLTKEISHYQKQVIQNKINHIQLEFNLKQNESKINQYKTIIAKLIIDSKENDRILKQENLLLQQCQHQTEKSKENIKKLNKNLKYSEDNYQNLKDIFHYTENENKQLKQQYADLTFVVQLLGQKQAILNNQLKSLYDKLKCLTQQHLDKGIHSTVGRV